MIDKWLVVHSLCVASLEKQYSCFGLAWNRISSTLAVVSDGPGRGFSGLACGFIYRRRCCFINHFLLPVKIQRTVFVFITKQKHWRPDAVNWTAAFVTGPALCKRLTGCRLTVNNPRMYRNSLAIDDIAGQAVLESGTGCTECSVANSFMPHSRYF